MKRLLLIALIPLAGCVTPGQHVAQQPTARDDPSQACFASIPYDARFVPLREKIAINLRADQPTLEMLADKTTPSDPEKRVLSQWIVARGACFDSGISFRAQYAPVEVRSTMAATNVNIANLTARLYAGEITYGEFNRARASNAVASQTTISEAGQRQNERNAAIAAQDEENRRQAVGAALQNMQTQMQINQQNALQQQQILQQNRPRTTNCNRFGTQVNCTTY